MPRQAALIWVAEESGATQCDILLRGAVEYKRVRYRHIWRFPLPRRRDSMLRALSSYSIRLVVPSALPFSTTADRIFSESTVTSDFSSYKTWNFSLEQCVATEDESSAAASQLAAIRIRLPVPFRELSLEGKRAYRRKKMEEWRIRNCARRKDGNDVEYYGQIEPRFEEVEEHVRLGRWHTDTEIGSDPMLIRVWACVYRDMLENEARPRHKVMEYLRKLGRDYK